MYCPNCGLANEEGAKFCANCGTTLGAGGTGGGTPVNPTPVAPSPAPYQQPGPYQMQGPGGGNSVAKNIGIGCLVAILIFFFVGLSCTRACFGRRHSYLIHRY